MSRRQIQSSFTSALPPEAVRMRSSAEPGGAGRRAASASRVRMRSRARWVSAMSITLLPGRLPLGAPLMA